MQVRPPRSTRTDTPFPYTTLCRSERVRAVTHPEDFEHTLPMAQRALDPALREKVPYEYRIVRPDGQLRWVLAHGQAVFDGDGPTAKAEIGRATPELQSLMRTSYAVFCLTNTSRHNTVNITHY